MRVLIVLTLLAAPLTAQTPGPPPEAVAELPGAAVKRLVTKNAGDLRISGTALAAAVAAAEDYIGRLARAAGQAAQDSKRKTIMDSDIEKARQTTA